jgi:hypothetical protein
MRWLLFLSGALLASLSAHADMYPDSSNAKLPEASRNLGQSFVVKPGGSIQAGLTAAKNNGGGTVNVQAGNYHITQSLRISSRTRLQCEAGAWITFDASDFAGVGGPASGFGLWLVLINEHTEAANFSNSIPNAQRDQDIEISGCSFRAGSQNLPDGSSGAASWHIIFMREVDRLRIDNITCMNGGDCTAMLGTTDTAITRSKAGLSVTGNTHGTTTIDGIRPGTEGIAVGDRVDGPGLGRLTHVTAVGPTSLTLSAAATSTVTGATLGIGTIDNVCWDHWQGPTTMSVQNNFCVSYFFGAMVSGTDTFAAMPVKKAGDGTISGNRFQMVGTGNGAAIWLNGLGVAGNGADRVTVMGNTIRGDGVNHLICFRLSGQSDGNRFIGNTCDRAGPASVVDINSAVEPDNGPVTNTLLMGNLYTNITTPPDPVGAIYVNGAVNTTMIGETLKGNTHINTVWDHSTNSKYLWNNFDTGTGVRYFHQGTGAQVLDTDNTKFGKYAWTPDLTFGGNNAGIVYNINNGNYWRTGQMVCAYFNFHLLNKGTSTGLATIKGLPVAAAIGDMPGNLYSASFADWRNMAGFSAGLAPTIVIQANEFVIYGPGGPTNGGSVTNTNFTNQTFLIGGGCYPTDVG